MFLRHIPTLVDLNSAPASELEKLPGIGPVKAKALVAFRNTNGPFSKIDDLLSMEGIGSGTIDLLRPFTHVSLQSQNNL